MTVHQVAGVGCVVIDATVSGRARGGLRLMPDVTEAELRLLARSMTLKYGWLGLPQGGAKAGVVGDPEGPAAERRERLAAFARAFAPLLRSRAYIPDSDMGTTNDDIRRVAAAAGLPAKRREWRVGISGYYTALTVLASARAALQLAGRPLAGATAAIEGYGKVGSALGRLLAGAGARVVAVSSLRGARYHPEGLPVERQDPFTAEAEELPLSALFELPVDLLCPCARHHSIDAAAAPRVHAAAVAPGANNPLTAEAEASLTARGVLVIPDFVANCGGVLGGTMEFASLPAARIRLLIETRFAAGVERLLRAPGSPRANAEREALARFEETRRRAESRSPLGWAWELGLELYRRGWIPGSVVAGPAQRYFERRLG
jgi:glutamate dehydrogenase (NAD(P)+)